MLNIFKVLFLQYYASTPKNPTCKVKYVFCQAIYHFTFTYLDIHIVIPNRGRPQHGL